MGENTEGAKGMIRKLSISILVFLVFLYPQISFSGNEHKPNLEILNIVRPSIVEIPKKMAQVVEIGKSLKPIMMNRDNFQNNFENNPASFLMMSDEVGVRNLYAHVVTLLFIATWLSETTDYGNSPELEAIICQLKIDDYYFDYVISVLREAYGHINNQAALHLLDKLKDNYISTRNDISRCVEQLEALKQAHK